MKVSVSGANEETCHLRIEGAITQPQDGRDPIREALGEDAYLRCVLLDLGAAESIDSAGVGWLMLCRQRFQDAGGRFALHSQPPVVGNVLRILSLDQTLNIAQSEAEALRMLREGGT